MKQWIKRLSTCTGGRLEDLEVAARILAGKRVSSKCRLIVVPASTEIPMRATEQATPGVPGESGRNCVACVVGRLGAHQGVLAAGKSALVTSSRNFPGGWGARTRREFIASPAISRICDKRPYCRPKTSQLTRQGLMAIEGRTFLFGDNVDTDQIYPGRYLALVKPEEVALQRHEGLVPASCERFIPGSIIVAGRNFGCGSSREHAPVALKSIGVSCVVAESFGRIFYRNAINMGPSVLRCKGVHAAVREGDPYNRRPDGRQGRAPRDGLSCTVSLFPTR